jgi:putative ABC transport system ATP-binding protein
MTQSVIRRERRTTTPTSNLIELDGVEKTYRSGKVEYRALRGVDLTIAAGDMVAIVGPSGSGKSTVMNMITGIDRPTVGTVTVDGRRIDLMTEEELAVWRGARVGVVFQFFQLLPTLTVAENVELPMDFAKTVPAAERRSRALALLERVGIRDQAGKLPAALSGGEQQRAAIARALANDPPILLADEPTGNLDSATGTAVLELLAELNAEGRTVVVVTHERDIRRYISRLVTLADGRVVAGARPDADPGDQPAPAPPAAPAGATR